MIACTLLALTCIVTQCYPLWHSEEQSLKVGVTVGWPEDVMKVAQKVAREKYHLNIEIVTFNDYVALFAIRYARSLNIQINQDLTFVSYANTPLINYMDHVPIATVEQFPYLQGQKATDILIDLLNKPNRKDEAEQAYYNIIVESQLVVSNKNT